MNKLKRLFCFVLFRFVLRCFPRVVPLPLPVEKGFFPIPRLANASALPGYPPSNGVIPSVSWRWRNVRRLCKLRVCK